MLTSVKTAFAAVILIISVPFTQTAHGADFESPRIAALGGASRAGPLLNDAIFLNPSFVSFLNTYSLSANYLMFNAGSENAAGYSDFNGHLLSLSIQDGRSDLFQAGMALTRREDAAIAHIVASKALIPSKLSVGLDTKLILPNDGSGEKLFDGGLSASYVFFPWFQASIGLDNLLQATSTRARGFYREVSLGTKFTLEGIAWFFLDPHWTPDLPVDNRGFNAGIELPLLNDFFLRLGKFNDSYVAFENRTGSGYGFGLGWLGPKISFDYAFQRVISPLSGSAHIFGLTIYF